MRRRLVFLTVWLAGAVALGWGLWPSRYRPWPLPPDWFITPVPGTHCVDHLPILDPGDGEGRSPAFGGAWERWDMDTGGRVLIGPMVSPFRDELRYGSWAGELAWQVTVGRPADAPADAPLQLIELPYGRELGRHPAPAHLFAVGEPGDGLYAVGLPAVSDQQNQFPVTEADLAVPWQVHIHEAGTGRRLRSLSGASFRNVVACGRLLVTIEPREKVPDKTPQIVSVWDVTDGRRLGTIPVVPFDPNRRNEYFLSGNGRYLLCGSGQVWEVASGATVRPAHVNSLGWMTTVTRDGRWLFQFERDSGEVAWFDAESGAARTEHGVLPQPSYGNAGGSAHSAGPWGDGRVFVTRSYQRPPNALERWLTAKLPRLFPPDTTYRWFDFCILDPATGRSVLSAPVFAYSGTDDGELLFVSDVSNRRWLYDTRRQMPWTAVAVVVGWTAVCVLVHRRFCRTA